MDSQQPVQPAYLREVAYDQHIALPHKMPYIWTALDTRNAVLATIAPGALGVASLIASRPGGNYQQFLEGSIKPNWADQHPALYSAVDALTLTPLGYASYLVFKNGGGFDYTDTTVALTLYGTNLIFAAASIPLIQKKNYKGLLCNTTVVLGTAIATAVAFHQIDEKAGWLVAPYAAWTVFYGFLAYKLHQLNRVDKDL
uniref:TspO/MBR-related protein n=1 Tax=Panagrellus redivivus TaxID=6233 RepID=A0A7E4URD3_PANRE